MPVRYSFQTLTSHLRSELFFIMCTHNFNGVTKTTSTFLSKICHRMVCGSASSTQSSYACGQSLFPSKTVCCQSFFLLGPVYDPCSLTNCSQMFGTQQCHAEKERWSLLNGITEKLKVEKYPAELFLDQLVVCCRTSPETVSSIRDYQRTVTWPVFWFFLIRADLP